MTRSAAATARSTRATATIRDSINPTTAKNLETTVNATARTIRKSNAATAKAALAAETAAATETITAKVTRKPRAPRKVANEVTPANAVRLAAAAKKVAIRLLQDFFAQTDEARAELAEPKAMAAVKVANERALAAGLEIPFADRESMGFGSEDDDRKTAEEMDAEEVEKMEEEIAAEKNAAMLAEDAAKVAEKHLDAFGAVKLSPRQSALMAAIGNREFSFFDEGIVADSGIWHSCMTGEIAGEGSAVATTAKGVANVIAALGRKGLLEIGDLDEGDVWVSLTASGASLANSLATPKGEKAAPAKKAAAPKAKATKTAEAIAAEKAAKAQKAVEKAAKVTKADALKAERAEIIANPERNPKVIALAEFAVSMGWVAVVTANAPKVVVSSERDNEKLTTSFIDGKLDLEEMPKYTRVDGSVVILKNVSAVKKQMGSAAEARPVKATKSTRRVSRINGAEENDETPIRSLPFNVAETSNEEIAEILKGSTVTWKRADGVTESAIVGKKVTVSNHPTRPGKSSRIASFFEMVESDGKGAVAGGQRTIGIGRLLTVGK